MRCSNSSVRATQPGSRTGGAGHGGDAFAAADEAEAFHRRRLDADARRVDAEDAGDGLAHGLAVRRRSSAPRTGTSRRRWRCARRACARAAAASSRKMREARAAPVRVAGRKVLADVAVADGAEQRVGERVQRRRRRRSGPRGDACAGIFDPAQPDVIAGGEAVHVKARAVARLEQGRGRRQQPLGERDVGGASSASCCGRAAGDELDRRGRPTRRARHRR